MNLVHLLLSCVAQCAEVAAQAAAPFDLVTYLQGLLKGHGVWAWSLSLLVPLLSKRVRGWIRGKGIGMFVSWWVRKVKEVLAKDHGPIWDWYIDSQIAIHVELAQRLFPGEGMGPQRREWLFEHCPHLKEFEPEIEAFVKANKDALKALSKEITQAP